MICSELPPISQTKMSALRKRISRVFTHHFLAYVICGVALLTVAKTISLTFACYSPVPSYDQWSVIERLVVKSHPFSWSVLWEQHNEHRLLVGRLLGYADLLLLGHKSISLFLEIYLVQLGQVIVLVSVARSDGRLSGNVFVSVLGFVVFCCFSPLQLENFIWGFQVVFVLAQLAASFCFASAVWHSAVDASDRQKWITLIVCIASACLAEASLANGILVWPLLFLLARGLQFGRKELWIIAITGSLAIAAYLIGYRSPPNGSNPLSAFWHFGQVLKYMITYLAESWDGSLPNVSHWPVMSELLTFAAVIVTAFGMIMVVLRKTVRPVDSFLFTNMSFGVGTAVMTALGRLRFGSGQAVVSRYQTVALIFWACFALLLARYAARLKRGQILAGQVLCLMLLISTVGRWNAYETFGKTRRILLNQGWAALVHHSLNDPSVAAVIFPAPQVLPAWYHYLRAHHLEPTTEVQSEASIQPSTAFPSIYGYRVNANSCLGSIEAVNSESRNWRFIRGWAQDREKQSGSRVVLVDSQGRVAAYPMTGKARPDVQKEIPEVKSLNVGWTAMVNLPGPGDYYAFLLDGFAKTACPLKNLVMVE
jgi:hypothetical protein